MIRVRLFRLEKPVGFIRFEEAGHHVRPEGLLPDDSLDAIRRDLKAGRVEGMVNLLHWYRQATPFCPLDPAKPCPCDAEICEAEMPLG